MKGQIEAVNRMVHAQLQVSTPELEEAAHYLIARVHELKTMAEQLRPDLLVEVSASVHSHCA